jgi:hypothetical protein
MGQHIPVQEQPLQAPPHSGSSPVSPPRSSAGEPVRTAAATDAPASLGRASEPEISSDQIAVRAYEIWLSKGRPDGCDVDDWLEAERQLHRQRTDPQSDSIPLNRTR